jgi:hypothetical protein
MIYNGLLCPFLSFPEEPNMQLFLIAITLLTGFTGIYLGFRAFKNYKYITEGELPFSYLMFSSVTAGGAGALIFFTIILAMSFLDVTYVWTIGKLLGAIVIPLILGGVITIGSFVQAIMITRYRRILLDVLRRKGRNN